MVDAEHRNRIVFLGAGGVGKTSILKRFLNGEYSDTYEETVEDLYPAEYDVRDTHLLVDFLDTAGNIAFPAMRRLSIANAQAFVLVFSITDISTFEEVKQLWEQIKEVRTTYETIPCVIVGNKLDLENNRQVEKFDALNWAYSDNLGSAFVEVSAKDDDSIKDIFKMLLDQLKTPRSKYPNKFMIRRSSTNSIEPGVHEETETDDLKMQRSRSLIRRESKPKMKRSSRGNKNDCSAS